MVQKESREIAPISRSQAGCDNFATLVTAIVIRVIRVSYIIICNGLAMTNLLRTDTRVHEHAVSNDRVSHTAIAPCLSGGVCKRGVYPGCQVTPLQLGDATIVLSPPAESLSHRQCCRLSLSRDPTQSRKITLTHEMRNNFLQSLKALSPLSVDLSVLIDKINFN